MRMRSPHSCSARRSSLSQTGCARPAPAKKNILTRLKQRLAQHRVDLERVGDLLEALGHVEVDRRRDLAQVAQRLADQRRRRLAFVDVERAAVVERDADVVVAAEGVVPRQPVDQHRRLLGQRREALADHLLVRAQHALGVDHALGQLGRARREQELGDRVGADPRVRRVDGRRSPRSASRLGERRRRAAVERRLRSSTTGVSAGTTAAIALRVRRPAREHQARREQAEDVAQLAVVLRDQRVRRRDRRVRHAGEHRAEREQQVLDVVVGQDRRPAARPRRRDRAGPARSSARSRSASA